MGGFFGVASKHNCRNNLYYGTDYNSHLGTRRAGMATYDSEAHKFCRKIHSLDNAYFRTKFEKELDRFNGQMGIGIISDTDPQPIVINSHLGKYAIVTVAKICNLDALERELIAEGVHFGELSSGATNQTELVALLINKGKTFAEGIRYAQSKIEGSCSMLILTEHSIIAVRDKLGRTPVVLGKNEDGYAVGSETTAFPNLGYESIRDLAPAEAIEISPEGITPLLPAMNDMQICAFLWVYYGFPTSSYEGKNVEDMRFETGFRMAQTDDIEVDCACGIPDSGVGMALGYAAGKGIPYRRCISKYTPTWPRSFTPADQSMRDLVAKMKLVPNKTMLKDKRVVFCDDSIVRGTQLNDNVKELFAGGAKEVHMRIACPPLIYGCRYIGFTSSKSDMELLTRRLIEQMEGDPNKNLERYATAGTPEYEAMVEMIRERYNLTSLKFSTMDDIIAAIGLPKCKVCTHCFDGSSRF